ncbi:glycoside hydrolase family 28 protein [Polluticaenibacter yanchengensis]|uniref:Glycoside hydrolase family 28 protein n=1 Tax=Polluticaenibacter yanchengensis TaxID=3014562 RepID=A0ABT4UGZ3_9BACT|nr:glycoside hydrolase family 28 protein [Chitinophagaceae bacterium LY-5]
MFKYLLMLLTAFSALCIESFARKDEERIAKRDSILKNIVPPSFPDNHFVVTKFGAVGDSLKNSKPAFDKAMAAAKKKNGGKVIVPPGVYILNGPIHFVSNVNLELQKGATLVFGTDAKDYLPVVFTSWEGTMLYNYSPFIYGYQLENIAITGEGVIDGNAKESFNTWHGLQKESQLRSRKMNHENTPFNERIFGEGYYLRPHLIQFFECRNILIEGITIKNAPFWCVHLLKSENITARRVKFDAYNKNNDGFDPEYSKNVLIEDIDFNNADDNVAIKAGRDYEGRRLGLITENIIIRNCRFKGLHGVVIGSEMSAGVRNVFVEDCTYGGYCKRGIYLKSNPDRGGFIKNVFINNVAFGEVEDCFFITSYYHGEGSGFETEIKDVFVNNLKCKAATNAGIVIQGFPTKKVTDIYFNKVLIESCKKAISFTNTENIVFNDVIIGEEVSVPSHVK